MNYLTRYYKNLSEELEQKLNLLQQNIFETKLATKDYDGDGTIESGTKEYLGSKDNAIKKAIRLRGTKGNRSKFPKNIRAKELTTEDYRKLAKQLEIELQDLKEGLQKALRSKDVETMKKEMARQNFRGNIKQAKAAQLRKLAKAFRDKSKLIGKQSSQNYDPITSLKLYHTSIEFQNKADQYGLIDQEHSYNWEELKRKINLMNNKK